MASPTAPRMFLAFENWSPRFEKHFFTFQMQSVGLQSSAPSSNSSDETTTSSDMVVVGGKENHPAYYYRIDIYCGHERATIYRRYSQFYWLYKTLAPFGRDEPLIMPPGSCFWRSQDDAFAKNRMGQLSEFLEDALKRPDMASHPAVFSFLELGAVSN
jgi:hypothetical protein